MREYPHLTALRLFYAQTLLRKDVRIQGGGSARLASYQLPTHPGLRSEPPGACGGSIDAWDSRSLPRASIALARTAVRMGDYDEAVVHLDNLLGQSPHGLLRRACLALKGVARYKQHRS